MWAESSEFRNLGAVTSFLLKKKAVNYHPGLPLIIYMYMTGAVTSGLCLLLGSYNYINTMSFLVGYYAPWNSCSHFCT